MALSTRGFIEQGAQAGLVLDSTSKCWAPCSKRARSAGVTQANGSPGATEVVMAV